MTTTNIHMGSLQIDFDLWVTKCLRLRFRRSMLNQPNPEVGTNRRVSHGIRRVNGL